MPNEPMQRTPMTALVNARVLAGAAHGERYAARDGWYSVARSDDERIDFPITYKRGT
jgi:hypothetical protein